MTPVYRNRNYLVRQNLSLVVLAVVFVYGLFELWRAFASPGGDTTGAMFGVLFLGGSLWGAYTLWSDGRDVVAALEADFDARQIAVTAWVPFSSRRLVAAIDDSLAWRFWVKPGARGQMSYFLHLALPGSPRPLSIELKRGETPPEGLRRLAPAAIAEFEAATGRAG
jgi:hypothetical protein